MTARYYRVQWTDESGISQLSEPIHRYVDAVRYAETIGRDAIVLSY